MRETAAATIATAIKDSTRGRPLIISITIKKDVIGACVTAARNPVMPTAISAVLPPSPHSRAMS